MKRKAFKPLSFQIHSRDYWWANVRSIALPKPSKVQTPLLLLSNAINHREGEKWKREPPQPQPHAMQQQPMPMPAQAPPTAGITTEQIQKVPPLCPPPPPLSLPVLGPGSGAPPSLLGRVFLGGKRFYLLLFLPGLLEWC